MKRTTFKNRAQLEKEVAKAQNQLSQIFFKDFEEKIDYTSGKENNKENVAKVIIVAKEPVAYNKYNDEEFQFAENDVPRLGSKILREEAQSNRVIKDDDPAIKKELKKYNYKNMVDLNRDFQFYINNPDKLKKISRAMKVKKSMRSIPSASHSSYQLSSSTKTEVSKVRELPRTNGFMSVRERKRILNNLF